MILLKTESLPQKRKRKPKRKQRRLENSYSCPRKRLGIVPKQARWKVVLAARRTLRKSLTPKNQYLSSTKDKFIAGSKFKLTCSIPFTAELVLESKAQEIKRPAASIMKRPAAKKAKIEDPGGISIVKPVWYKYPRCTWAVIVGKKQVFSVSWLV